MKNCCPNFYTNFISLIPDEIPVTIQLTSPSSWYILYPPSNFIKQQLPIPTYHQLGVDDFIGWTSRVPLDCAGNTNYSTGKCLLVYSRMEEAPTTWLATGQSPVNKSEIPLVGRCIYPKITTLLQTYPETYCFYTASQFRVKDIYPFNSVMAKANWSLGFQSARAIPGQVLVSEKVFGTPVNLDLRVVGNYKGILDSYNLQTTLDPTRLLMATVNSKLAAEDNSTVVWNPNNQSFTIGNLSEVEIVFSFSAPIIGNLTSSTGLLKEKVARKVWGIKIGLAGSIPIVAVVSLVGIVAQTGTIVTVSIGNQITEVAL